MKKKQEEGHEVPRYAECHHFQVVMSDECPWCLKSKLEQSNRLVGELQNALRDVFDISEVEGAVNLTTMEYAKLLAARDLVPKTDVKRKDEANPNGWGQIEERECPDCGAVDCQKNH